MKLKVYNTLSKKKELFVPGKKNNVRIYVCGPTVDDVPHLGHARQQIFFDLLRKYLEFLDYKVKFVSNITDIEDKIINRAKEKNKSVKELVKKNYFEHMKDYKSLGIKKPTIQPKATDYVKEMINPYSEIREKRLCVCY